MNNIQLPIAKSPIIGYQYLAYPLTILANDNDYLPWFFSNYIQLIWNTDLSSLLTFYFIDMQYNIPWINYQLFEKNFLKKNALDLNTFIIKCINDGWYFYSSFDEFFVPDRMEYQKGHTIHDFMIYGYNLEKGIYYILGFNKDFMFDTTIITFKQFEEAFSAGIDDNYVIKLMKKKEKFSYNFDMYNVFDLLSDYFYSRNSSARYRYFINPEANKVFGMNIYKYLYEFIELLLDNKIPNDIRPLHIIYEHKKCMNLRFKYMINHGLLKKCEELNDHFNEIEIIALDIRDKQIKYYFDHNNKNINLILVGINKIESMEKNAIEILLNQIGTLL